MLVPNIRKDHLEGVAALIDETGRLGERLALYEEFIDVVESCLCYSPTPEDPKAHPWIPGASVGPLVDKLFEVRYFQAGSKG